MPKRNFTARADGAPGRSGRDGADGANGYFAGADGARGDDASAPTRGADAADLAVALDYERGRVAFHAGGHTEAVALGELDRVQISARGGAGGHGANGGHGGHGARGRRGSDATRSSRGTDGGPGGDGGDGGYGTSGADGGAGGELRVVVQPEDTWLLMAVEGADAPDPLVVGGRGGAPGRHGSGGSGGGGGPGGSSYSWTTTTMRTEHYTDANGSSRTRTVPQVHHHSNPGGSRGRSGYSGRTPTTPLVPGRDGPSGRFEIVVGDRRYPARYDLTLDGFQFREVDLEDADGVYEPGERLSVTALEVRNQGRMPTPVTRARLVLPGTKWIAPEPCEVFLEQVLAPEQRAVLDGELFFRVRDPEITQPGPPLNEVDFAQPRASQLGPERGESAGPDSDFERVYPRVSRSRALEVRFPIENLDGVRALRSLAPGERSRFSFEVKNRSKLGFGARSARARRLWIRVDLGRCDVEPGDVWFEGPDGARHLLVNEEGAAGFSHEVEFLDAGASFVLEGVLGLEPGVRAYAGATLRFSVVIDHVDETKPPRVCQVRELTVRSEPGYAWRRDMDALLVTNDTTTRAAYEAWHRVLEEELGLSVADWSLTRHGHLDHTEALPDGTDLRAHLEDKLVIVLNNPFHPRASEHTEQPVDYLRGRDFRRGATTNNTHHYILTPRGFDLSQHLEPTADVRRGGEDYDEVKSFLKAERDSAGPLTTEIFKEDITAHADKVEVHAYAWPFARPDPEAARKKALKLLEALDRQHPNRRYVLVYEPMDPPVKVGHLLFVPRWHVGTVWVRRSLNTETSSAVILEVPDPELDDVPLIEGAQNRFAVLLALPFEDKLERLAWLLRRPEKNLDRRRHESAGLLARAILVDLAQEQRALRQRKDRVDDEVMEQKLSNLLRLLRFPMPTDVENDSNKWDALVEVCAGITAFLEEHEPWWQLFGKQARINRFTRERLAQLIGDLFDSHAIDPEGEVAMHSGDARERIRARADALKAEMRQRRERDWPGASRKTAAQNALIRPREVEGLKGRVSRDVDLFTAPQARLWTRVDLERAQLDEKMRDERRRALFEANRQTREELLVVPAAAPAVSAAELEEKLARWRPVVIEDPVEERVEEAVAEVATVEAHGA